MSQDTNENNAGLTFFGGLLALLMGLPGVMNAFLEVCSESIPYVGRWVKPTFWTLFGMAVLQWMFAMAGVDGFIDGVFQGVADIGIAILDMIPGVSFVSDVTALPAVEGAPGMSDVPPAS
ncbi:MAG: hypothetical protein V3S69_05765 [Dehalococcoidales bacterium]